MIDGKLPLYDDLYVFTPNCGEGIVFMDIRSYIFFREFLKDIPDCTFLSPREYIVLWSKESNGKVVNDVPVTNDTSIIVNEFTYRFYDDDQCAATLIVSPDNYEKILHQVNNPVYCDKREGKLIKIDGEIIKYDNIIETKDTKRRKRTN